MNDFTDEELEVLVEKFAEWHHPAVRRSELAYRPLDGDGPGLHRVFKLIASLSASGTSEHNRAEYASLATDLIGSTRDLLSLPERERDRRRQAIKRCALALEPLLAKLLEVVDERAHAELFSKSRRPGVGQIIKELHQRTRLPVDLTDSRFEPKTLQGHAGWDGYPSFDNALKDYFELRNQTAHTAREPRPHHWESVLVVAIGAVIASREQLEASLVTVDTPCLRGGMVPSGLPSHRRIPPDSPEPFTTRAAAVAAWSTQLFGDAAGGRVYVVEAGPGWGKSAFLAKCLENADVPVHYVDLTEAHEAHLVAEALLVGVRCTRQERESVDASPAHAARVLGRLLGRPGIVLFENLQRNRDGCVPTSMDAMVEILAKSGHTVVLESWMDVGAVVGRVLQGNLVTIRRPDLEPLSMAEVQEWGRRLTGRELSSCELEHLELMQGSPLAIRAALEHIRRHYPEAHSDAGNDLLEIATMLENTRVSYECFLRRAVTRAGDELELPEPLWAWFGVLPWAEPRTADLPDEVRTLVRKLAGTGLVTQQEGRAEPGPWARVLGLHRLMSGTDLTAHEAFLARLASEVPADVATTQQRHLLTIASALPSARELLHRLMLAVPRDGQPLVTSLIEPDRSEYRAPAPSLATALAVGVPFSASAPTMPADLVAWGLEGAARRRNRDEVEALLMALYAREEELRTLSGESVVVRALHHALLVLRPRAARPHYERVLAILSPRMGEDRAALAQRIWLLRTTIAAGDNAARCGKAEPAEKRLAQAAALAATLVDEDAPRPRAILVDTRYRIRALACRVGRSLPDLVAAHEHAMEVIPDRDEWGAWAAVWARRALWHIKPLLRANGPRSDLLRSLRQSLAALPPSSDKFHEVARYLRDATSLGPEVRDALESALEFDASDHSVRWVQRRITDLLLGRPTDTEEISTWAEDVLARVMSEIEPECVLLLRLYLMHPSITPREARARFEIANQVLEALCTTQSLLWDETQTMVIRRVALDAAARHLVGTLGTQHDDASAGAPFLTILRKAERRIDGMYARHVDIGEDPWLWDEWISWRLRLQRRASEFARRSTSSALGDIERITRLRDLLRECRTSLGEHPAFHAASFRVERYVWNESEALDHAERLLDAEVDGLARSRTVRLVAEGLTAVVLRPAIVPTVEEHDPVRGKALLLRSLEELLLLDSQERRQGIGALCCDALRNEHEPSYWQELVERAQTLLGTPSEYWQRVVVAAHAPAREQALYGAAVDDLTDSGILLVAAQLCRYGACLEHLPRELRFELAQVAVAAARDAESWQRTTSPQGRRPFLAAWQVGLSIGLALLVSPDGTLFGSEHSDERGRSGAFISWRELMFREFDAARSGALGRFRVAVHETAAVLRAALPGRRG